MIGGAVTGPDRRPLRFGIMCTGLTFPAWQARCIQQLLAKNGIEPVLLIIDETPQPRSSMRQSINRLLTRKMFLWRFYERAVLNRTLRSSRPVDLTAELSSVPTFRCQVEQVGNYTQRFFHEDLRTIREYDLDFVLRFAFNIIRGEILSIARYGVWSFHHGDPDKYRGTPPGFWEIYKGDPLTGAMLQRLTDRLDAGIVLHRGYFKTIPFSYPQNVDGSFFGSADWPARVCAEIQNGKATYFSAVPCSTKAPIYHEPNDLQMLHFGWVLAKAWLRNQMRSLLRHQQWNVGVIDTPIEEVVGLDKGCYGQVAPRKVSWVNEIPGRFLADPFAIGGHRDFPDSMTLLVEEFDWSRRKGQISMIESKDGRIFSDPHLAIRAPYICLIPSCSSSMGRPTVSQSRMRRDT
jgi:hypothetical protein